MIACLTVWQQFHNEDPEPFGVAGLLRGQRQGAEAKASPGDWPSYNHDTADTRYSPLTQINTKNVATSEAGVEVFACGQQAGVAAIRWRRVGGDADCGERRHVCDGFGACCRAGCVNAARKCGAIRLPAGRPSTRGVAYWPGDKQNPPRIIFTAGRNLIALNATTGKIDPGFGKEGMVDMVVGYGGVPTVFRNVVHGGRERSGSSHRAARRHARLRCANRRETVGFSHRAAARRSGP